MTAPEPFLPEPYIEIAWGFGPYDVPTGSDWVDITDDVNEIHSTRGRDSELDTYAPGEMTLVLDNFERQYDPMNSSGPNYGELLAGVPIRFRADIAGTKHDIFYGFVEGWPASYSEGGFVKELEIKAYDASKYFAERSAPDTMQEDIESVPGVGIIRRWYPFDQVRDGENVIADKLGTGPTDLIVYSKWDTQEKIAVASPRGSLGIGQHKAPDNTANLMKGAGRVIGPLINSPIQTDQWAIAFVLRVGDPGQMDGYNVSLVAIVNHVPVDGNGFTDCLGIVLHQGGKHHPSAATCPGCMSVQIDTAGTSLFFATAPGAINDMTGSSPFAAGTWNPFDGEPHSFVLWRHSTTLEGWADGVKVGSTTAGGGVGIPAWDPNFELRVYWPFQGLSGPGRSFPGVSLQELMFMDNLTGSFDPVPLHEALMVGLEDTAPSGIAARTIMTRCGWDLLKQEIDDCEVPVRIPANPHGRSIWDHLQGFADSEDGRVFVNRHGNVAFHSTARFQTETVETTIQYTFADNDPSSVGIEGELRVVMDDSFVYEEAEVTRENGPTQRAASTSTPARTYSLSGLQLLSDHQAQARAEKIVWRYAEPQPRTESWQVWPEVDSGDWATLLGLDIGHRVRLVVTPGGVGSQIDLQQHLELIEHHVTATDWVMVLNGSPVDDSVYLVWGGSGAQGWGNGVWR